MQLLRRRLFSFLGCGRFFHGSCTAASHQGHEQNPALGPTLYVLFPRNMKSGLIAVSFGHVTPLVIVRSAGFLQEARSDNYTTFLSAHNLNWLTPRLTSRSSQSRRRKPISWRCVFAVK